MSLRLKIFFFFPFPLYCQEIVADEENVRKVSSYLTDVVLPKFVQDLCTLEVSPMDGQTLTEALHAHGINVRYIGKVCNFNNWIDWIKHISSEWKLFKIFIWNGCVCDVYEWCLFLFSAWYGVPYDLAWSMWHRWLMEPDIYLTCGIFVQTKLWLGLPNTSSRWVDSFRVVRSSTTFSLHIS